MSHTPGPWKAKHHNYGLWRVVGDARTTDGLNRTVQAIIANDIGSHDDEGDAKSIAHLIAAAPELLESLDDCQAVMDAAANQISTDEYIDPAELKAAADQLTEYAMNARAAIAKAQGGDS